MAVDVASFCEALVSDSADGGEADRGSGAPSRVTLVVLCLIDAVWIGVLIGAVIVGAAKTSALVHGLF